MKEIMFLTGTRADFGKLKILMQAVRDDPKFECTIFATGMHLLKKYGYTYKEIEKAGLDRIVSFQNQHPGEPMETVLANTIEGLSRHVHEFPPDLIIVHGDRVEALAGAIVGALNNIRVAHIEGGERSGTVDELIRHSVSKLSHIHFASNAEARSRLLQMGEDPDTVFVIGSPDIDVMKDSSLPNLQDVKGHYGIPFENYSIVLFHPVTTEFRRIEHDISVLTDALVQSGRNYIVIYPNNDTGCEQIISRYQSALQGSRFRIFPSIRFEFFLVLLSNADFIIGNSSAGVREAPLYNVPCVNIGSRQNLRAESPCILNTESDRAQILEAINRAGNLRSSLSNLVGKSQFGDGRSVDRFLEVIRQDAFWTISVQKSFRDLESNAVEGVVSSV